MFAGLGRMNNESDLERSRRLQKENDIRNAALEEAAKVCDKYESYGAAYEIRTMKK